MNNGNNQRQSRWGAPPASQQPPPPDGNQGNGGGPQRDRAQSWNSNSGRGYDTVTTNNNDAPAASRFDVNNNNRDSERNFERRDDSRGGRGGDGRDCSGEHQHHQHRRPHSHYYPDERYDDRGGSRGDDEDRSRGTENVRPDERGRDGRRSFDRGNGGDRNHRRDDDRRGNDYGDDGHYGPPSRGGRRHSRSDDDDYNDDRDGDRRPRKKTRDSDGAPMKREYPPRFEASGASFIFDARSGMFYEPASDFFYDPKTKLYYGNKKRQYFRYDAEKKKEGGCKFVPIGEDGNGNGGNGQGGGGVSSRVVTAAEEAAAEAAPPDTETRPEKVETKPKIAISLKTTIPHKDSSAKTFDQVRAMEKTKLEIKTIKRKKSSLSAAAETNDAAPPQSHKKHAKNMDKWSERVKEMKDENADDTRQPASEKVKTTASGQPICILCRRKFANSEKLAQHEKLSALHKENAAKKLAADDAAKEAEKKRKADANYRDRSKERRQMYGANHVVPESSHAEAILAHSLGNPTEPKAAEMIRPEETLNNDANVGNKLLQKLGWKSGGGLGRNAGKDAPPGSSNGDVASNLKSDWERIESLAQRGGGRR